MDKRIKEEARARRESIQDVVYDIQNEHDHGLLADDETCTELRECCLNYSQAFCLLAQLQALAQLGVSTEPWKTVPHCANTGNPCTKLI